MLDYLVTHYEDILQEHPFLRIALYFERTSKTTIEC